MMHSELLATDTIYARLYREHVDAASAADAASDGAIHHAHDIDVANRIDAAITRDYWATRAAFLSYQSTVFGK